jgi:hypothetical protein
MPSTNQMPHNPESKSDILRSSHILQVTVESAQASPWVRESGRFRERSVRTAFRLDRIWKGELQSDETGLVELTIRQWETAVPRFIAVPGAWSGKPLEPGVKLVAFCCSHSQDMAELLQEPACGKVETAEIAVPDLELAWQDGSPLLSVPALLARTFGRRASFGYLYAQYVSARMPELLFSNLEDFGMLMRLLEDAQLAPRARWILLTDLYSLFLMKDPAPIPFVERLLSGTFRILALTEAAALRAPMLETYIPNLAGLEGGADPKRADQIFDGNPEALRFARQTVKACTGVAGSERIAQWLHY